MIENFESEKITSLQTVPEKGPMRVFKLKLNDQAQNQTKDMPLTTKIEGQH